MSHFLKMIFGFVICLSGNVDMWKLFVWIYLGKVENRLIIRVQRAMNGLKVERSRHAIRSTSVHQSGLYAHYRVLGWRPMHWLILDFFRPFCAFFVLFSDNVTWCRCLGIALRCRLVWSWRGSATKNIKKFNALMNLNIEKNCRCIFNSRTIILDNFSF